MNSQQKSFVIRPNNPFKDDIIRFQKLLKEGNRIIKVRRTTIIDSIDYFPGLFTKMYQNKEALSDLTMEACKILMYMALNMNWVDDQIKLNQDLVGIGRRGFSRGILDLLMHRIIVRHKPQWYWVNVTILIVGNIEKHDKPQQNGAQDIHSPDQV